MPVASPIKYRKFGKSNKQISQIGLGCASAWGQPWFDETKAIEVVHRALDLGITVFDTGPSYSKGNAEPRLTKALAGVDRSNLLVSTKAGTHIGTNGKLYHDLSRDAVFASVEASRKRLEMDTIPLLYLHGPLKHELNEQLFETLDILRHRGWVESFGVNSFDADVLELLVHIPQLEAVMLDYNVLRINREPLIAKLHQTGKFIVAGAAVANHLFSPGFFRPKSFADVWYALRALKNYRGDLFRARRFSALKLPAEYSYAQLALAFVLSNEKVDVAMFGTTRVKHLDENVFASGIDLSPEIMEQIRSI